MKNLKISSILMSLALLAGTIACQSPEEIHPSPGLPMITGIKAKIFGDTIPDNNFTGEIDLEKCEIRIVVPYNYPVTSDALMTLERLTKVSVVADIENNVIVTPPLHFLDLSHDNYVDIRDQYGVTRKFRIYADIRKNSECDITDFEFVHKIWINKRNFRLDTIKAFPSAAQPVVQIPYAEELLGEGAANVVLSPHATISPNPSDTLDYDNGVEFTVTAQNGVDKKVWIVQRGIPATLKRGLREASAKILWTAKLANIGCDGKDEANAQNGIAPSGNYILVNQIGKANPVILDRNTGAVVGNANFSDIAPLGGNTGNYCVTADEAGHILICNTDQAGTSTEFKIWRMDNVFDTPREFLTTKASYNYRGHHISVIGDIDKDAVITTPLNGTNAWFTRWIVKDGKIENVEGEMIQPTGFGVPWTNCDIVYKSPKADSDYFINAYTDVSCSGFVTENRYVTWVKNDAPYALSPTFAAPSGTSSGRSSANWINSEVDYKVFNGVGYVLDMRVNTFSWGSAAYDCIMLYDTQAGNLSTEALNFTSTKEDGSVIGLKVNENYGAKDSGTPPGLGGAANGLELQVSEDGYYMYIYFMFAKGSIGCVRVDCFDI